jgi:hypothetical protein
VHHAEAASPQADFAMNADTKGENILLSQYIKEGKNTAGTDDKTQKKEQPVFIAGFAGGLSNRESFASVSVLSMFGIQYKWLSVTIDPEFTYMRGASLKSKNHLPGAKSSGEVLEFGLPAKCTFSILDLASYPYTPYVMAGLGYNYRKYAVKSSLIIYRIASAYHVSSFTLNYGFGFIVKTTEQTRFQIGLSGISYFNTTPGTFNYDTTGASLMFGIILMFD